MISLLKSIREELIIERENKLRNALILATAIVMFAVPLNFMVEVSANYIDTTATGELQFDDFYSYYFWLFCFCMGLVLVAFSKFYIPISRIFMDSFRWDLVFKDVERKGEDDAYHIYSDEGIECWVCEEDFESLRSMELHEADCRLKHPDGWADFDKGLAYNFNSEGLYECLMCSDEFETLTRYFDHVDTCRMENAGWEEWDEKQDEAELEE